MSLKDLIFRPVDKIWEKFYSRYQEKLLRQRHFEWNKIGGTQISSASFIENTVRMQFGPLGVGSIVVGDEAVLTDGVVLATFGGNITIGEGVFLGPYCVIYGHGGVKIGRNTLIASHTSIVSVNHLFSDIDIDIKNQGFSAYGIDIGENVWIGSGARILDGVSIGNGCVVGAGAVVTKSLPENSIAVGVPAKVVGNRIS